MAPLPTVAEVRLNDIIGFLKPTVALLKDISDIFGAPFVPAISNTTLSLITAVQSVKRNKEECIQLMENVHTLLYIIVNLHMTSEPTGILPPATLDHVGTFTKTLHKIHTFVEAQQDGNRIKHFFRQSEMNKLLKECHGDMERAFEMFRIHTGVTVFGNIIEMQKETKKMHTELLELISILPDGIAWERGSSIHYSANSSHNRRDFYLTACSTSISMLPAKPKIFHGRDTELKEILETLHKESARIAILGAGGIGKTSLSKATLHHPDLVDKYHSRFFVACDSATTTIELAALIGSHIGLSPRIDPSNAVVRYFSKSPACLLILDNFETVWEPLESRSKVEDYLGMLTDIPHLGLVITMRGAERPAKVRWTRPFMQPLQPLSNDAARQTFVDIAEDFHNSEEMTQVLSLTANLPLAVDLMAHLVDSEGCTAVLARWETEKTSMLSNGYDRKSNLHTSIEISVSSPRMSTGARDLLSLLSICPDGLSDVELLQSKLPMSNILTCKAVLLGTCLAYMDGKRQLKSLAPIREYMQSFHPPPMPLIVQFQKYFYGLLQLYQKHLGTQQVVGQINQITSNLGNLHQILLRGLRPDNLNLEDAIECTLSLNSFSRISGHGRHKLMDHIPTVISLTCDVRLHASFITEILWSHTFSPVSKPEQLISKGVSYFSKLNDPSLESRFYCVAGNYYEKMKDISLALQFLNKALVLARSVGDKRQQCNVLNDIAHMKWATGDYAAGQVQICEGRQLAQLCADFYSEARTLRTEAMCLQGTGDYATSIALCQRARALLELCGMSGCALDNQIIGVVAEVHLLKSEYTEARSIHIQVAKDTSGDQNVHGHACSLLNLAMIDIMMGVSRDEVHQTLDKARVILNTLRVPRDLNFCSMLLADLHLRELDSIIAQRLFRHCLSLAWENDSQGALYALERLGDVSRWPSDDLERASTWLMVYLGYAGKMKNTLALYKALQFLGDMFHIQGDQDTAQSLFIVALEGFSFMDVHHNRAQCMLRLGDILEKQGSFLKAWQLWKDARPLFKRSLQAKDIIQIDSKLAAMEPILLAHRNETL
ncbi:hypothetical protein DFH09DRAFT_1087673 [Mycena vulgaris]|nr:hypothetical protein DFH09DRAFT_1087673 [Mycena vulgaris]